MEDLRLVLIGFGSVNRALVRMLLHKSERRRLRCGSNEVPWRIVCIVTLRHGVVCVPIGTTSGEIDIEAALQWREAGKVLDHSLVSGATESCQPRNLPIHAYLSENHGIVPLLTLLGESHTANVVVEATPTQLRSDSGHGESASSYIRTSLQVGMHVVSANKGPLAQRQTDSLLQQNDIRKDSSNCQRKELYWQLQQIAHQKKVKYLHEAAVMDGVPIFSFWKYTLPHAKLTSVRGCLNSTTTMILTTMERNLESSDGSGASEISFEQALQQAKDMGIVEQDESLDLDGYDAAIKLRALLVVLAQNNRSDILIPSMESIPRDSIRSITREDIQRALDNGRKKYRLVASAEIVSVPSVPGDTFYSHTEDNAVINSTHMFQFPTKMWNAQVRLHLLPPTDPLYNLTGTSSSIQFGTDVLGPVTIVSSDPTLVDTAYGLFSDILRVVAGESI